MSAVLLPDIAGLAPESLCHSIYSQLYHNFFNAQDKDYITEGDNTSILLHNTAYNFASAIAGAIGGDGSGSDESGGGVLSGYLKKTGGDMTGTLHANYGFEAGMGNTRLLATYRETAQDGVTPVYGLRVYGDIHIGSDNLFIGEKSFIRYNPADDTAYIENPVLSFGTSGLRSRGTMLFGQNKETGVLISEDTIHIMQKEVYHGGNANLCTVDWKMKNATITGGLDVGGKVALSGELTALHGTSLGDKGKELLLLKNEEVLLNGFLNLATGCGIKIGDTPVLVRQNETDARLSCNEGDLLMGSERTYKIRLFSALTDIDGDNILITKYGGAYFPDSFRTAHNYGAILLSTYRVDDSDEGIVIHKRLRLGTSRGMWLSANDGRFSVTGDNHTFQIGFIPSVSLFAPQNRDSFSARLSSGTDFIVTDCPLEAKTHVGVSGTLTRLTANSLFFSEESSLSATADGIKHSGNARFEKGLSSVLFSSGFAGAGWAILPNPTTGNVVATFDELTIRKRMRVYELEVQKHTAVNGSLWVSDSCRGDSVELIE